MPKKDIGFWVVFLIVAVVLMWFFSDFDFSLLMTLSSLTSMFALVVVALQVEMLKSVRGVSLRMFECYSLVFLFRLIAILPYQGYLPYDKSGDWLYQVIEISACFLSMYLVYIIRTKHKSTYDVLSDTFPHWTITIASFILAVIFHPSLNSFFPVDVAWSFALYLEAVAVLPQLLMFQKQKKAQGYLTHFLAAQALSRIFNFVFWMRSHDELNGSATAIGSAFVGWWVLFMQLVQVLVMADFIYYYIQCLRKGISVEYVLQLGETV
jgi:ER lumen protein retaining receptor